MRISLKSRTLGRTVLLIGGSVILLAFLAAGASTQPAGGSELRHRCTKPAPNATNFDPSIIARNEWPEKINTMFHLANLELAAKNGRPIWGLIRRKSPVTSGPGTGDTADAALGDRPGNQSPALRTSLDHGWSDDHRQDRRRQRPALGSLRRCSGPRTGDLRHALGWVTWTDPDDPKGDSNPSHG